MKLASYRRIITQDYSEDDQELIEQLGGTVNDSFNSIYSALNKRINFTDNIASTVKELVVTLDSNGIPQQLIRFNVDVPNTPVVQVICGRARNITNPGVYPTAAPFVSFTQNGNTIIINHITGLAANQQWRIIVTAIN
jgi:hypothetical protein